MPEKPHLPPPVAALIAAAFPAQPLSALAPTVGGFSNLTVRARIGAAPVVIKAAEPPAKRADLGREALVLATLGGRRLGAPRPLAFAEGGGWAALVTARRPGTPGMRLYAGPADGLGAPLAALGRALARLHSLPLPPPPAAPDLLLARRAEATAAALDGLPVPADVAGRLREALAHPAWRPAAPRLVHGDPGLHNVLWGRGRLTLLDWELAGWGDPRLDLAWAAWTLRFRGLPPGCRAALTAGYGPEREAALRLDGETALALALGQVAALLVRAAGRPAWHEWLRRARWTAELHELA
jgi:aminoglycoside phosphotransferase (APT) family kinase protein